MLEQKSCLASKLCFNKGLASNLQWLNSSLAWSAKRWKNKSCLAAKMFAQILAGSFVPVAGVLAVVQSERASKERQLWCMLTKTWRLFCHKLQLHLPNQSYAVTIKK